MDQPENTVEAREDSMRLQLAGGSAAVTAAEAAAGLAEARRELAGRGAGYGVGFGYVKNFGSPRGLDGIKLEYAITDGERVGPRSPRLPESRSEEQSPRVTSPKPSPRGLRGASRFTRNRSSPAVRSAGVRDR